MAPLNGSPPQQATNPQAFFGELTELQQLDADINIKITEIENLQHESLSHVDEGSMAETSKLIEASTAEVSQMNRSLAGRIRILKSKNINDESKSDTIGAIQRKFETTLNRYRQVEVAYQRKAREQIARQYKIANPDATPEQLKEIQDGDSNAQIFASSTMSTRTGAARSALAEVRSRHNDIQKIEKTMVELAELFEQMNQLVVEQETVVDVIAEHAEKIEDDTREANKELTTAIKSAEGARKKKWWCLLLVLIIIIIIVIIVVVVTKPWAK
ncbi:Syntaxin-1A [Dactylellina cionopaga]|nr:Syntaxin-1A [Dactylellina cionopaga]